MCVAVFAMSLNYLGRLVLQAKSLERSVDRGDSLKLKEVVNIVTLQPCCREQKNSKHRINGADRIARSSSGVRVTDQFEQC